MNQRGCPSPVCSALLIIGSGIDGFLAGGPWARKEEKPRRKAFRSGFRASHRAENRSTIKPLSGGFRLVRRADQSHLHTFLCRHREQNKRMQWHSIWKTDRRPSRFDIGRGWFYFHVQLKEDHCLVSSIPHSQKKKSNMRRNCGQNLSAFMMYSGLHMWAMWVEARIGRDHNRVSHTRFVLKIF